MTHEMLQFLEKIENNIDMGQWDYAQKMIIKANEYLEYNPDVNFKAFILSYSVELCRRRSNFEGAIELLQKIFSLENELTYTHPISSAYNEYSQICRLQGNYAAALKYRKKQIEIAEESEDPRDISTGYGELGLLYTESGKYDEALKAVNKAIQISNNNTDHKLDIHYGYLGAIYSLTEEYDKAEYFFKEGIKLSIQNNNLWSLADQYNNLGNVSKKLNKN